MGTVADKLNYLNDTKKAVKQAIESKDMPVPIGTSFRGYADKIKGIYPDAIFLRGGNFKSAPNYILNNLTNIAYNETNRTYVAVTNKYGKRYLYGSEDLGWINDGVFYRNNIYDIGMVNCVNGTFVVGFIAQESGFPLYVATSKDGSSWNTYLVSKEVNYYNHSFTDWIHVIYVDNQKKYYLFTEKLVYESANLVNWRKKATLSLPANEYIQSCMYSKQKKRIYFRLYSSGSNRLCSVNENIQGFKEDIRYLYRTYTINQDIVFFKNKIYYILETNGTSFSINSYDGVNTKTEYTIRIEDSDLYSGGENSVLFVTEQALFFLTKVNDNFAIYRLNPISNSFELIYKRIRNKYLIANGQGGSSNNRAINICNNMMFIRIGSSYDTPDKFMYSYNGSDWFNEIPRRLIDTKKENVTSDVLYKLNIPSTATLMQAYQEGVNEIADKQ